jgi:hypothetical protein
LAACSFHPDRPAVGICMRCRVAICTACCTRLNGVNHCHACLAVLARSPREAAGPLAVRALSTLAVLAGGWLVLFLLGRLFAGRLAP